MLHKKVNKNGSITLPKQIRATTGIFSGSVIDIEMMDGGIKIKKHTKTCNFCGNYNGVKSVMGIDICMDCARKIHEKVVCDNE